MANDKMVTVEITMEEFASLVHNYSNREELAKQYDTELMNISKNLGILLNECLTDWQIKELREFLRLVDDEEENHGMWEFLEYLSRESD